MRWLVRHTQKGEKMGRENKDGPKCPKCGEYHKELEPIKYRCPQCDDEMFDCCCAGVNTRCCDCENGEDDDEDS